MTPIPTYKDHVPDDQAREQLGDKVLAHRHTDDENFVPPRGRPKLADEFLEKEVQRSMKMPAVAEAAEVARFYALRQRLTLFEAMLDKRERDPLDGVRSIEVLRLMGDLGDAKQLKAAAQYFDYLLNHRLFDKLVGPLIECYFHLDATVTDKPIADRLKKKLQELHPGPEPVEPTEEYADYRMHLHGTLPITMEAKAHKEKLVASKDSVKRATGLARTYIGLDDPGAIEWPRWSGFTLMIQARESGEKDVIAGLEAALAAISPQEKPEYVEYARARATRAIAFLGGKLTDEQAEWLAHGKVRRFQLEG